MNSYTKISLVIATEIIILSIIGTIIRQFINSEFDLLYILIAQFSLLSVQLIDLIMQKKEFNKIYIKIKGEAEDENTKVYLERKK